MPATDLAGAHALANEWKPGQALVWLVFGYPEQDPVDPLRPGPPRAGNDALKCEE